MYGAAPVATTSLPRAARWDGDAITVVVVNRECLMANAIAALLSEQPGIAVVGTACDLRMGAAVACAQRAQILVVDADATRGLDVSSVLARTAPKLGTVILRSDNDVAPTLPRFARTMRSMSVPRSASVAALVSAVRQAGRVGSRMPVPLQRLDGYGRAALSAHERCALTLAAQGLSSTAISAEMNLARGTVRNYISRAIRKTGAQNRIEAARFAYERGWL